MSASSKIEEVARAIYAQATEIMDGELPENWDDCGPDHDKARAEWTKLAVAAVRALRMPDGPMVEAAFKVHVPAFDFLAAWQAAIDSILADTGES